jgi:hypothetical protein
MKRFDFRLQRTMDWRQVQCDSERVQLERLHGQRREIAESRDAVQDELHGLANRNASAESCRAEDLHRQALFTRSLFNLDRKLSAQEDRCSDAIEQQVRKCVEADRAHRLLEKLRDAGKRKWSAELDREVEEIAAENWNAVNRNTLRSGTK